MGVGQGPEIERREKPCSQNICNFNDEKMFIGWHVRLDLDVDAHSYRVYGYLTVSWTDGDRMEIEVRIGK